MKSKSFILVASVSLFGLACQDDSKSDSHVPMESQASDDLISDKPINGKDGKDGRDGVDGKDGVDGLNGADGQDGANGLDGVDGLTGADGTSCSSHAITGGFAISCGDTTTNYMVPISPGSFVIPQNFKNSTSHIILTYEKNVTLPSQFTLDALENPIASGANGRITIKIDGISYCYQSAVSQKRFNFIGERADGLACHATPYGHQDLGLPSAFSIVDGIEIILEHRSDLANRWKLSRPIEISVANGADLVLN